MSSTISRQNTIETNEYNNPTEGGSKLISLRFDSSNMIELSEIPGVAPFTEQRQEIVFKAPTTFTKMMALFFGVVALSSLVAIISVDTIGMGGGPVLISFKHYLSLLGTTFGAGSLSGLLKWFS